jgi:hypothetical protein
MKFFISAPFMIVELLPARCRIHPITNRGGLTTRAGDTDAQTSTVEQLGEKLRAGGDGGTNTTRSLDVGDRLLNSSGCDQDLTGPANATAILRMKQHPTCTQKVKSFGVAPLVKRAVRTLHPSAPGLDDQGEGGHATTADAAKKVISKSGRRRNLQALPMTCNLGGAIG